jgi:prepilin peptidase CpaA
MRLRYRPRKTVGLRETSMDFTSVVIVSGKLLVFGGLVSAAAWDLRSRIVPNWLVLAVGGVGLILRMMTAEWHGIWVSACVAAIIFVMLRLLSALGTFGGGDVKLISAIALGQPPAAMLPILLGIGVAGGVIAIFYIVCNQSQRRSRQITEVSARHLEMPYAPAILAGFVWYELGGVMT